MATGSGRAFGAQLKELRRSRGLSQSDLGGDKYSGSYISYLESGRRAPTVEVVGYLAERLSVPESVLYVAPEPQSQALQGGSIEAVRNWMLAERAASGQDWRSAAELASSAAKAAKIGGDPVREWEARFLQAKAEFFAGNLLAVVHEAEALCDHPPVRQTPLARAQALNLVAASFRGLRRHGEALAYSIRAVDAAEQLPAVMRCEGLVVLISTLIEAGLPPQDYLGHEAELERLLAQLPSGHARGLGHWALGTAAFVRGESTRSLANLEQAQGFLDPQQDPRQWSRLNLESAWVRLCLNQLDKVDTMLDNAAAGLELVGNHQDHHNLRQAAALFALRGEDPQAAARILLDTLDPALLSGDEIRIGLSKYLLGRAMLALEQVDEARRVFAEAGEALEREGRLPAAVEAWKGYAGKIGETFLLTQA